MMKLFAMLVLIVVAGASSAHEISRKDQKSLLWLSQMAGLHAQKTCALAADNERSRCQAEQVKSLAETAASLPGLRPADISAGQFAAMIEYQATVRPQASWLGNAAQARSSVDCRIDVC